MLCEKKSQILQFIIFGAIKIKNYISQNATREHDKRKIQQAICPIEER